MSKHIVLTVLNLKSLCRINPDTKCWEWIRSVDRRGYGQKRINKKLHYVHRLSFALFRGEIPDGMLVCHRCDNPPCCNPRHLFIGTYKDNHADCKSKNRHSNPPTFYGESHPNHKLSRAKIKEAREGISAGNRITKIARKLGVARQTLRKALNRVTWST